MYVCIYVCMDVSQRERERERERERVSGRSGRHKWLILDCDYLKNTIVLLLTYSQCFLLFGNIKHFELVNHRS